MEGVWEGGSDKTAILRADKYTYTARVQQGIRVLRRKKAIARGAYCSTGGYAEQRGHIGRLDLQVHDTPGDARGKIIAIMGLGRESGSSR